MHNNYELPKDVELICVKLKDQVADIFMKPLKFEVFSLLRYKFGMMNKD